jgi:hypothetical protein
MNLQQIIDEQNALHQPSKENCNTTIYVRTNYFTAESVFSELEKYDNLKPYAAVLALMSLANYEDTSVEEQHDAWLDMGCFKEISRNIIEDIDDLDKFEQAKLMQMFCGYILELVSNEQTTTA